MKVAFVLGTSAGGTRRHVRMLAEGCAARGVRAVVLGPGEGLEPREPAQAGEPAEGGEQPAQTAAVQDPAARGSGAAGEQPDPGRVRFERVEFGDAPRVPRDTRAVLRLRRLIARSGAEVVHAHGLRAGALAAIALGFAPRPASGLPSRATSPGEGRPPAPAKARPEGFREAPPTGANPASAAGRRAASAPGVTSGDAPATPMAPTGTSPPRHARHRRGPGSAGRRPALVVTVHNAPPSSGVNGLIYGILELIVARNADAVLCVSGDLEARMRRAGAGDVGHAVVPALGPGTATEVPADAVAQVRAELGVTGIGRFGTAADAVPAPPGERQPPAGNGEPRPGEGQPRAAGRHSSHGNGEPPAGEGRPRDPGDHPQGLRRRPVVLAVGRLAPQKGFGLLLEAAVRWRGDDPVPLLVIAGDGPLAGSLARAAEPLGRAVRFLGSRDDVPVLLAAADVAVVPSRWEGQPLFVQEALRAGKPLVAARTGGIPDLTGDDAALLVPPGDPEGLAAAVRAVLADPAFAARLGTAARERATRLPSENDAVEAALACYRRVLRRRGTAS